LEEGKGEGSTWLSRFHMLAQLSRCWASAIVEQGVTDKANRNDDAEMKREQLLVGQVVQKLLPFLFLLCLISVWSKITGGYRYPSCTGFSISESNFMQIIFGSTLNLLMLTFSAALFCAFEACQLIYDLRATNGETSTALFVHLLQAGLPIFCFIQGKLCWKVYKQKYQTTPSRTHTDVTNNETLANFDTGQSQTIPRFFRELALFTLIFFTLAPFQSQLLAAPRHLVENIRLYMLSQKLIADQATDKTYGEELKLAEAYANMGEYKKSFAVIDALLSEISGPLDRERLANTYLRLSHFDLSNRVSAAEWLKLTNYADKKLEAIFSKCKPERTAAEAWNRKKNETLSDSLKFAADNLIRAYQRHGCTEQAIKWIEAKGILQRKLLGADRDNLQKIYFNLKSELIPTGERQNYAPLLHQEIARLECTQLSMSPDSWSEHWRRERLEHCLDELKTVATAPTPQSIKADPSHLLGDYDEVKASMKKELSLAEQSGDYAGAKDIARDMARLIHRYHNTVSHEAASYYNRMIELESRAPSSKVAQLSDLLEASKSNLECGNLKEGEEYLAKIQILKKSLFGEHYNGQARDLNDLALAYLKTGNAAEARPLYEQALRLDSESIGAENKAIAIYLNNLGQISEQLNDLSQAEKYYQQALRIDEKTPADKLNLGSDYENLGKLYLQTGQKVNALNNLVAARESKSKVLGAYAVEVVDLDRAIDKAKSL
jgi:tetratricopeptide (TPR) repeat protein